MLRRALPTLLVSSALAVGCNILSGVDALHADDADASALVGNDGAVTPTNDGATSSSSSSSSSTSSSSSSGSTSGGPINAGPDVITVVDSGPRPTEGDFNGHHYVIVFDQTTWTDAKNKAEKLGGHLVTLTTPEENEFVRKLSADSGLWDSDQYGGWLGARRIPIDGGDSGPGEGWTWVTGEEFKYTHWLGNEPNNDGGNEFFLGFYAGKSGGGWNDFRENGDGNMPGFIVEIEPTQDAGDAGLSLDAGDAGDGGDAGSPDPPK